jgi:hypothetical protein
MINHQSDFKPEEPVVYDFGHIQYYDREEMKVLFCTLIINVASIIRAFGSLKGFLNSECKFTGAHTNGKLVLMYEMKQPPPELIKFSEKVLEPAGFLNKQDYVITYERKPRFTDGEPGPELDRPIPECESTGWLGSRVTDIGNFVWLL